VDVVSLEREKKCVGREKRKDRGRIGLRIIGIIFYFF
jgi:hypothetical protein